MAFLDRGNQSAAFDHYLGQVLGDAKIGGVRVRFLLGKPVWELERPGSTADMI